MGGVYRCVHVWLQVIEAAKKANGKIFVHCKAGVSRSVTVTVAYLMSQYKWSLKEVPRLIT